MLISKQYPLFSLAQQPQETMRQLQCQVSVISLAIPNINGDELKSYDDKNLEKTEDCLPEEARVDGLAVTPS